ncbi:MAG: putative metal-binding motif-containing protein [Deltaproteobacteria bacterium]|nr:putative metal-binding motif-containing protein [Deltaproteobacteria bacterium]
MRAGSPRISVAAALALACAVAAGCGGGGVSSAPADPGGRDLPQEGGDLGPLPDEGAADADAAGHDPGEAGPDGDDPGGDGGPDGAGDPGPGDQGGDEAGGPVCPGSVGCECKENSDCLSGYCTDTMEGRACTAACSSEESCPPGWSCLPHVQSSDIVFVCSAPWRLCQPCRIDADCEAPGGGRNVCIEHGPQGWFCGTSCADGAVCPDGFECRPTDTKDGPVDQCVPASGAECPCTERFAEKGYVTVCERRSDVGTCSANRTCDEPCPAPFPALESCNGADDDCDGLTDEDAEAHACDLSNAYGTCQGTSLCVGGKELCQGTYASQEVCNEIDDDCDGETDEPGAIGCDDYMKDSDGDGFGVATLTLCLCEPSAPYTATVGGDCADDLPLANPSRAEVCNAIDDDCDGDTDEGFPDENANGIADCAEQDTDKDGDPDVSDCAPLDPDVSHMAVEVCNGVDDNCSGAADEGFPDLDGDGTPDCMDTDTDGDGVADPDDCEPLDATVYPGAAEVCNGKDDDCDGVTDEVCGAAEVAWELASCSIEGGVGDAIYQAGFGAGAVSGRMPSSGEGPGVCMGILCLLGGE